MKRPHDWFNNQHTGRFELFEERLPLSAESLADFWIRPTDLPELVQYADWSNISTEAASAVEGHGWTDIAAARNQYGLRGGNQTVAVIDSGIAYDHVALGGGLGKAYRVVGGWDFAENDADPYDDGPAGFHGTHVAGIIGSSDSKYTGVASGVDLVSLRVFDDAGAGYFQWVEQALQWVHAHRFDYDNPITTVNLSLGTEWNASTLPNWATLEDELKVLEDDGIFISVAAGNSFKSYNAAGLSYPAVSDYVTPVASVDKIGNMSVFSQRNSRVLAAPGEKIMSTLPDAFYGGDGNKTDFGATSGTSMAAPYVAGASVLVREAFQAMGYSNINQDLIYDRLYASADLVYDSITNASYHRVNVGKALESVIGADDVGSTDADFRKLGFYGNGLNFSGTIGTLTDKDYFRFTAEQTGTVTIALGHSGNLQTAWSTSIVGAKLEGDKLTFNVVAGEKYVFGIGTATGIGRYQFSSSIIVAPPVVTPPPPPTTPPGNTTPPTTNPPGTVTPPNNNVPTGPVTPPTSGGNSGAFNGNLGRVTYARQDGLQVSGEQWVQVTASRSGLLTVEAVHRQSNGNIKLEVYNASKSLLKTIDGTSGIERLDINAAADGVYFVRLVGTNADVDLRVTNMLTVSGGNAKVQGSTGDDAFVFSATSGQKQLSINGVSYVLGAVTRVSIVGGGGNDSVTLTGSNAVDTVTLRAGQAELRSATYLVTATQVQNVTAYGGSEDQVALYGALNDQWASSGGTTRVTTTTASNAASGFGTTMRKYAASSYNPASYAAASVGGLSADVGGGVSSTAAESFQFFNVDAEITEGSRSSTFASDTSSVPMKAPTAAQLALRSELLTACLVDSDMGDPTSNLATGEKTGQSQIAGLALDELNSIESVFDLIGRAL